jgi:hypothetical protein
MFNFLKTPKIKFYSSIPSVTKEFPIVCSKTIKRTWFKNVADEYNHITLDIKNYKHQFSGVAKCPGIIKLMTEGFVLRSWFDFIIDINQETGSCSFVTPPNLPAEINERYPHFGKSLIQFMNLNLPQMKIPIPDTVYPMLIKITTPWAVEIPKGWKLLFLPIPYADETDFISSSGILSPGDREINPQLFWKKTATPKIIPAGTPLCQIVPIPDNTLAFECLDYSEDQIKKQDEFFYNKSYRFKR